MNKFCFISATIIGAMIVLTGCVDREAKQKVYSLGKEYTFGSLIFKAGLDESNERFYFDYKLPKENKEKVYFSFNFHNNSTNATVENDAFSFKDEEGKTISFDEFDAYELETSCVLYAYYLDADETVKDAISSYSFSIGTTGGTYIPEQVYNSGIHSAE